MQVDVWMVLRMDVGWFGSGRGDVALQMWQEELSEEGVLTELDGLVVRVDEVDISREKLYGVLREALSEGLCGYSDGLIYRESYTASCEV